jgi:tRNA(adenine34) deaminase
VNDLPSLAGLRLHYIDTGPTEATQVFLCLHSLGEWSYAWRAFAAQGRLHGLRVICPDLIGFGRSDKPKKASAQTLQWHAQVLQELIERLNLPPFTVRMPAGTEELARLFIDAVPHRVLACKPVEGAAMDTQALAAPFPDAGHQAALRALISPKIQVASKASEKSKK